MYILLGVRYVVENISGICLISILRMILFNQTIKTPIKCPSASPHKPFLVKLIILLYSLCPSAPTKQIRCQVRGTQPTKLSLWGFTSTILSIQSPYFFLFHEPISTTRIRVGSSLLYPHPAQLLISKMLPQPSLPCSDLPQPSQEFYSFF